MPKVVDHRERRRELANATSALIAEEGVDAVTIRSIADRLEYSTGIVQHYFSSKRHLLLYTLRVEGALSQRRVEAAVVNDPGDLLGLLSALMPLDEARSKAWKVWLAYWATAALDADVALEQRRMFDTLRLRIRHVLRVHDAHPQLKPGIDPELVARRLLSICHGIGMEAVCHPDDWPQSMQHAAIVQEITDLTGLPTKNI